MKKEGVWLLLLDLFYMHCRPYMLKLKHLRPGLLVAIRQGWSNVGWESNYAVLISALASNSLDCSKINQVVEDCKENMATISSIFFRHIYHKANDVANRLAHLISRCYIDDLWLRETLYYCGCLQKYLQMYSRGLDNTSPSLYGSLLINRANYK